MAKSAEEIALIIQDKFRRDGTDVITYKWKAFYDVVQRERIKDAFQDALSNELKALSILIAYGSTVVVVCKDFDFAPGKK